VGAAVRTGVGTAVGSGVGAGVAVETGVGTAALGSPDADGPTVGDEVRAGGGADDVAAGGGPTDVGRQPPATRVRTSRTLAARDMGSRPRPRGVSGR
jgi:hypothetical protein